MCFRLIREILRNDTALLLGGWTIFDESRNCAVSETPEVSGNIQRWLAGMIQWQLDTTKLQYSFFCSAAS